MAHCCEGDDDVIFEYDADDGAPLSAYFIEVYDAIIGVGAGINGTNAVSSADYTTVTGLLSETYHKFDTTNDECGNPRREFAVGAYWNGKNTYTNVNGEQDFPLMAIIWTNGLPSSGYNLIDVARINQRHLVVRCNEGAFGGQDLATITNVFDVVSFPFRKIEMIGSISTQPDDASGQISSVDSNVDAWVEIRIDDVPVTDGDDFEVVKAEWLKNDNSRPCINPRITDFSTRPIGTDADSDDKGWNAVYMNPQGDMDCIYVKARAAFCNDVEESPTDNSKKQDCESPGPGGSTFDGSAQGPRIVHPGGFPVSASDYVAPTGGGIPSTASDPSVPQSLIGVTSVLVSTDITLCDGTVRRGSQVGRLPQSGRAPATWLILSYSPIEYARSDRFGRVKSQTWEIAIADPDGAVRADLNSATNRFYRRWQGQVFAESNTARLAGTARLSLARGRCVSANTDEPQVVRLTFSDELNYPNSPYSLERSLPAYRVGDLFKQSLTATGLTPTMDAPENVRDKAITLIYGPASDEYRVLLGDTPVGINKLTYVGDFLLKSGTELWNGFVVCQYACKKVVSLFGSNLNPDCPASVRIDPASFSSEFLIPNEGNWSDYFSTNYIDVTVDGITVRLTMLFGRGPRSKQHVDGLVPLSCNVWGKENVGDSTGTLITDGAHIVQELYEHPVLQRAKLGNEAAPTFGDGIAKFKTSSAVACTTIHKKRLSGGYPGALIIDEQKSAGDWVGVALVSYHLRQHIDNNGQVVLTTLDDAQSLASLDEFTANTHVSGDSFKTTSERAGELENWRSYDFGPEPATGRLTGQPTPVKSQVSIDNWDDSTPSEPYKGDDLHLAGVYDENVARDVTARYLLETEDGITRGEWTTDFDAFAVQPGDLFRLTDFRGLGQTGWTRRVLLADSMSVNVNVTDPPAAEDLSVTVLWQDVQSLVAAAGIDGGGVTSDGSTTSRVGFNPLGSSAALTGWVLGSSAAGTGWRLG